jgi:hypothetical protein
MGASDRRLAETASKTWQRTHPQAVFCKKCSAWLTKEFMGCYDIGPAPGSPAMKSSGKLAYCVILGGFDSSSGRFSLKESLVVVQEQPDDRVRGDTCAVQMQTGCRPSLFLPVLPPFFMNSALLPGISADGRPCRPGNMHCVPNKLVPLCEN